MGVRFWILYQHSIAACVPSWYMCVIGSQHSLKARQHAWCTCWLYAQVYVPSSIHLTRQHCKRRFAEQFRNHSRDDFLGEPSFWFPSTQGRRNGRAGGRAQKKWNRKEAQCDTWFVLQNRFTPCISHTHHISEFGFWSLDILDLISRGVCWIILQ